jgi:hypothetical protein
MCGTRSAEDKRHGNACKTAQQANAPDEHDEAGLGKTERSGEHIGYRGIRGRGKDAGAVHGGWA